MTWRWRDVVIRRPASHNAFQLNKLGLLKRSSVAPPSYMVKDPCRSLELLPGPHASGEETKPRAKLGPRRGLCPAPVLNREARDV